MRMLEVNVSSAELKRTFAEVATELKVFAQQLNKLDEAITVPVGGDLDQQLAELSKRFEAARRGLSLVNRLSPGPQKTANASRVMGNLNTIRSMLQRVTKAVSGFNRAEQDYNNTDDLGARRTVMPKDAFVSQTGAENEEESSQGGWAHNTLDSILKTSQNKDNGGFCRDCMCMPCECGHEEEEYCPDCDGYEHNQVHPELKKSAQDSQDLKDWNLKNPFEQEEETSNSDDSDDSDSKDPNDDAVCSECECDPCECCNFCKKVSCEC